MPSVSFHDKRDIRHYGNILKAIKYKLMEHLKRSQSYKNAYGYAIMICILLVFTLSVGQSCYHETLHQR